MSADNPFDFDDGPDGKPHARTTTAAGTARTKRRRPKRSQVADAIRRTENDRRRWRRHWAGSCMGGFVMALLLAFLFERETVWLPGLGTTRVFSPRGEFLIGVGALSFVFGFVLYVLTPAPDEPTPAPRVRAKRDS